MKRLLIIIATMSLFVVGATAATALADKPPAPPGQDPCSHGNTGKPCKEDPQPEHGKDCDHHGNKGGVNEDHCAGTTTTTETTTTGTTTTTPTTPTTTTQTTTTQPVTPTTTQTTTTTPPVTTTTTTPNAPPAVVPPKKKTKLVPPVSVTKKSLEKHLDEQAPNVPTSAKQTPGELPNTGLPLGLVALLGAALTAAGLVLRRVG